METDTATINRSVEIGDFVVTRYGAGQGTQIALFAGATTRGALHVYRFRDQSGDWTRRVSLTADDILGPANPQDKRVARALAALPALKGYLVTSAPSQWKVLAGRWPK